MEASARGTSDAGGFSLGVTTGFYAGQSPNKWLSEVLETATPIDRLLRLVHEGDGYVILPGGTGTLLEFAAVWEMINKEILSSRPVVFLGDFWHSVISLVSAELVKEGRKNATRHFLEADSPIACVEFLTNYFKVQQ